MTIHGDYENGPQKIDKGENPYKEDRFYKYVEILDRLRKNSGVKIESEDNIIKRNETKFKKISEERLKEISGIWVKRDLSINQELRELLDSYELSLFYENTPLFDALCSYPYYDTDNGVPYVDRDCSDDVSVWGNTYLTKITSGV